MLLFTLVCIVITDSKIVQKSAKFASCRIHQVLWRWLADTTCRANMYDFQNRIIWKLYEILNDKSYTGCSNKWNCVISCTVTPWLHDLNLTETIPTFVSIKVQSVSESMTSGIFVILLFSFYFRALMSWLTAVFSVHLLILLYPTLSRQRFFSMTGG